MAEHPNGAVVSLVGDATVATTFYTAEDLAGLLHQDNRGLVPVRTGRDVHDHVYINPAQVIAVQAAHITSQEVPA